MIQEKLFDGSSISCQIVYMGKDINLSVYGGDTPHIGCVVMATSRPSLSGEGTGVTSSILNGIGHKDEVVARMFAEEIAKLKRCVVVCTCGIHIDGISPKQIDQVQTCCCKLLRKVLEEIK